MKDRTPVKIRKKAGVLTRAKEVFVYDDKGKIFYMKGNPEGKEFRFNLPSGEYLFDLSGPYKIGRPAKFRMRKLKPRTRRDIKAPSRIEMRFEPNPNKCSIYLEKGLIICDPDMKKLPKPCLVYVYYHEIGHYFYNEEEDCDAFAANQMLKRGYNPTQIAYATRHTLSDANKKRKGKCVENMKDTKQVDK